MAAAIILRGLAIAMLLISTACHSATGIVATYRKWDNILTVEVDERGYGRLEERAEGAVGPATGYALVMPGGRTIMVMRRRALVGGTWAGEGWVVVDSLDRAAWLARWNRSPAPSLEEQGPFREAGETRVGQYIGTHYVLDVRPYTWVENKELVVLRRRDLVPLGRLLAENSLNAWKAYGMVRIPAYLRDMARLMAEGAPLKVGDNFTLISLEQRRVDRARLRPPSRVLTRAELFRLLEARPNSNKPPQLIEVPH